MKVLPEKNTPFTEEKTNNLPYLRACIKEVIRVLPVAGGNFRAVGEDIVLQGYFIPKGVSTWVQM